MADDVRLAQLLGDVGNRSHQVHVTVGRMHAQDSVRGQLLEVELDRFLGDQVNRNRIRAEGINHDYFVIVLAIVEHFVEFDFLGSLVHFR